MVAESGALVLSVDGAADERLLTVATGDRTDGEWGQDIDDAEVIAVHEELRESLTRIHDVAGDYLTLTPAEGAAAVAELSVLANRVSYGLFTGMGLAALLDAAQAHAPFALDPAIRPRIVEIATPWNFGFPFELLRWHLDDAAAEPAIRVRALLGMSAIVRRRLRRVAEVTGADRIGGPEALRVTVFRHPELRAGDDTKQLESAPGWVEVHGPWPGAGGLPERALLRHLVDSRTPLDAAPPSEPSAVLHLACHCYTTDAHPDRHKIDVGGANGQVTLKLLKTFMSEPEAWQAARPRPLVFLNACGSAVPPLTSRASFAQFFLAQESLGVIGTLCDISDDVAAHFAAVFYQALLRGDTVGEAMYAARWHLMDRHRNPLGLLYTCYGNPDLRVARPQAGSVVPVCGR